MLIKRREENHSQSLAQLRDGPKEMTPSHPVEHRSDVFLSLRRGTIGQDNHGPKTEHRSEQQPLTAHLAHHLDRTRLEQEHHHQRQETKNLLCAAAPLPLFGPEAHLIEGPLEPLKMLRP